MRQKLGIKVTWHCRHGFQHMSKSGGWIHLIESASCHEQIEHGGLASTVVRACEKAILANNSNWSNLEFTSVVVDRIATIFLVSKHLRPLLKGITEMFLEVVARQQPLLSFFEEPKQLLKLRARMSLCPASQYGDGQTDTEWGGRMVSEQAYVELIRSIDFERQMYHF